MYLVPLQRAAEGMGLTLGELRSATCFTQSVLLSLDLTVVTSQHAFLLEHRTELGIDSDEPTSDAQPEGVALTGGSATFKSCCDVVGVLEVGYVERLQYPPA